MNCTGRATMRTVHRTLMGRGPHRSTLTYRTNSAALH